MRTALIAATAVLVLSTPLYSQEQKGMLKGTAPDNFEQRRTGILNSIDQRINSLQEERTCIQAAKSNEDIRSCAEKRRAAAEKAREQRRSQGRPAGSPAPVLPPAR